VNELTLLGAVFHPANCQVHQEIWIPL